MGFKVLPFVPLSKRFPKHEAKPLKVVRRVGVFRRMENGQIENGVRDFRRDLAALWRERGLVLSGRQFRKLRRADRHPEPPPAA